MKLCYLWVIKIKWHTFPWHKIQRMFTTSQAMRKPLNFAGSGTDVMVGTTTLQESIAYIFSSITLSHWRTKQSGLFTDPFSKHPPILVIKTIQWIIWRSFGFLCHAVDVCVAMFWWNRLPPSSGWLNLVQVVAEVVGMTQTCWLHGTFGGNLAKQRSKREWRIGLVLKQWEHVSRAALLRINSGECEGDQM